MAARCLARVLAALAVFALVDGAELVQDLHVNPSSAWTYRNFSAWSAVPGEMCDHKNDQSPIDVSSACVQYDTGLKALYFTYNEAGDEKLETNAHTWEVVFPPGKAGVTWDGLFYELAQFHFHAPSENVVDGKHYEMEMHMVHKAGDKLLVVAQFFDLGPDDNPYLAKYWNSFPFGVGSDVEGVRLTSPYSDLLASDKSYYHWMGSLTTPPCTNGLVWNLLRTPVMMSQAQLDAYRAGISHVPGNQLDIELDVPAGIEAHSWDLTYGVNNREPQPLGGRIVDGFDPTSLSAQRPRPDSCAGLQHASRGLEFTGRGSHLPMWFWVLMTLLICCCLPLCGVVCACFLCYESVAWLSGDSKSKRTPATTKTRKAKMQDEPMNVTAAAAPALTVAAPTAAPAMAMPALQTTATPVPMISYPSGAQAYPMTNFAAPMQQAQAAPAYPMVATAAPMQAYAGVPQGVAYPGTGYMQPQY